MEPGASGSRQGKVCGEEVTLPKEKSGLCPDPWEVTSKLLKLPDKSIFVIHSRPLSPHLTVDANKMTQDGQSQTERLSM